jgi:hypothetical protein
VHLAGPIIGQIVLGLGQSVLQPGVYAYLTAKKQKEAAAASAANTAMNFCGAGVGLTVAVPLQNAMGTGPFFSLICGINIIVIAVASVMLYKQIKRVKQVTVQSNDIALGTIKSHDSSVVACANGHATTDDKHPDNRTTF